MYCRDGIFLIQEILDKVISEPRNSIKRRIRNKQEYRKYVQVEFNGHLVKMDSLRYQLFKEKGTICVECGLKATHFALESMKGDMIGNNNPPYHFNLYGVRNGREVLFTKDHIHPASKGGKNNLNNMQTMCTECNLKKADKVKK